MAVPRDERRVVCGTLRWKVAMTHLALGRYPIPQNTRCHHLRVSTSCHLNCRGGFSFHPCMHRPVSPIRQLPRQSPRQCRQCRTSGMRRSSGIFRLPLLSATNIRRSHERAGPRAAPQWLVRTRWLSAELTGADPLFDLASLPPVPESGPAGPAVAAVAPARSQLCGFVDAQLARFAEVLQVPEPVWRGFTQALGVRLAERDRRDGRGGIRAGRQA